MCRCLQGQKLKDRFPKIDKESFTGSSDFVYAFRVRRIIVKWKTLELRDKLYVKGASVLHAEETDQDDAPANSTVKTSIPVEREISSVLLDDEDFGSDEYPPAGFMSLAVKDDEDQEICSLVIQNKTAE